MEQQDLLQEVEQELYLERASQGARFVNLLIDFICLVVLNKIIQTIIAVVVVARAVSAGDSIDAYRHSTEPSFFVSYLFGSVVLIFYYTILEGATKGRTLGKLVTGTIAVRQEGGAITWKDALIRSICRVVPFEAFSGLGTPWHDTWSNTTVVKVRK